MEPVAKPFVESYRDIYEISLVGSEVVSVDLN